MAIDRINKVDIDNNPDSKVNDSSIKFKKSAREVADEIYPEAIYKEGAITKEILKKTQQGRYQLFLDKRDKMVHANRRIFSLTMALSIGAIILFVTLQALMQLSFELTMIYDVYIKPMLMYLLPTMIVVNVLLFTGTLTHSLAYKIRPHLSIGFGIFCTAVFIIIFLLANGSLNSIEFIQQLNLK